MHTALPPHALGVIRERGRGPAVAIKSPVLAPHINGRIVEVGPVLGVVGIGRRVVVRPLVLELNAIQVQEVRDQALAVTLHNCARERLVARHALGPVITIWRLLVEVRGRVSEKQPVQVPPIAKRRRSIPKLVDDAHHHVDVLALI